MGNFNTFNDGIIKLLAPAQTDVKMIYDSKYKVEGLSDNLLTISEYVQKRATEVQLISLTK